MKIYLELNYDSNMFNLYFGIEERVFKPKKFYI